MKHTKQLIQETLGLFENKDEYKRIEKLAKALECAINSLDDIKQSWDISDVSRVQPVKQNIIKDTNIYVRNDNLAASSIIRAIESIKQIEEICKP